MSKSESDGSELGEMDVELLNQNDDTDDDIDTENEDMLLEQPQHYLEKSDDDDDDDDSDDDSDEDAENKLVKKYLEILQEIARDSTSYDNYVQLVETAHQISDLEKIRESCELFSQAYPLTPEIWLRWLRIELNIATNGSELKRVHQLFRRAFSDYFCATLAIEYANLATKLPKSDDIWEEILSTYALHCTKGRVLFEAWRVFVSETTPESPEKYTKLVETYERELSVPLQDMEKTYIELKVLCEKQKDKFENVDWTRIDERYNKAKEQLAKMLPFEEELQALDPKSHQERADVYGRYIDECKDVLNDQFIQIIHERMITDCCLSVSCWRRYIKHVRNSYMKPVEAFNSPVFSQTDWDIVNRALRNCSWSAELFIEKIHIAERMELPKPEVQNITEIAFVATVSTPESYLNVWLEYIAYLRRNTNFSDEKEIENLRANLNLSWESLERIYADPYCELLKMWGRLEYGQLQNVSKGKELWTMILENDNNVSSTGLWIEFAHLELTKGVDAARKIYRKAVNISSIDDIHTIISAWTRLERCHGTLDQLKTCQEACSAALDKYNKKLKKAQFQQNKKIGNKSEKRSPTKGDKKEKPKSKVQQESKTVDASVVRKPQKRKLTESSNQANGAEKRPKVEVKSVLADVPEEKDSTTVFFSNLSYDVTEDEIIAAFPELQIKNINLVKSINGRGRGFGYVELNSQDQVPLALTFDRRTINERPTFISNLTREKEERGKFKYSESLERSKLFVKGLPYDAAKEELEKIFGEIGPLKDIRLVCHKNGKSKGIAYVEYENESAASKAILTLDKFVLRNLTLSVALSDPPKPKKLQSDNSSQAGLGQGRRLNVNRGDQKPRLSFIPRVVQQKVLTGQSTSSDVSTANGQSAVIKSNDDFRKFILKQ